MDDLSDERIEKLVRQLADKLLEKEMRMVTAESCTGGSIAAALTAEPGSSRWFECGFVTYSNDSKCRLLNVPDALFDLAGPGAVSEQVALAMARGALAFRRSELSVAVTGIAGPDGGSEQKPVGTVWIAWQLADQHLAKRFVFRGDRSEVRRAAVVAALDGLLALVS